MRVLLLVAGLLSLGLGILGAVLPLLPTTPFVLLAAYCFARSSPTLYQWLLAHALFGPLIRDWREHRAIRRGAKWSATLASALVFGLSVLIGLSPTLLLLQGSILVIVLIVLWRHREPPLLTRDPGG